jgi:hypothetical protein
VRILSIVDTAQRAGLSLEEIRLLLDASRADQLATERLREVAERKLPEVREAIARAELVRGWLEDAAGCRCPSLDDCPLFDEPLLPEDWPAGRLGRDRNALTRSSSAMLKSP